MSSLSADDSCLSQSTARCCRCITNPCIACSCVKHNRRCTSCRFGERCPNRGHAQQASDSSDLADYVPDLKRGGRVLPRIPKSARIAVADSLAQRITAVLSDGTPEAWKVLLNFAYAVLRVPESSGRKTRNKSRTPKKSLASEIKQNVVTFEENVTARLMLSRHTTYSTTYSAASKDHSRLVSSKLADGDVRGALRVLTSDDSFANPTSEVIENIHDKHPEPPSDLRDLQPPAEESVP